VKVKPSHKKPKKGEKKMKKEKKDAYLKLLLAQHPDWVENRDPYHTLCVYLSFWDFVYCEACARVDDCWAYRVFEIRSDYEELYQCMEQLRTRLAETKTGKSLDWDLLLELMAQDEKLKIENYLSEKLDRQIKESGREKKSTSSQARMDEESESPKN